MRQVTAVLLVALALCTRAASARRELQMHVPKVDMPPITAFLPPLESVSMMPLSEFLNKTGLPQWNELGLPPIQELLKPVGGPRTGNVKFPSKAEFAKMANDTMVQVIQELLPPELKAFAGVQLPKLKMGAVLPQIKLPALPSNLPPLHDILKALPPMDPAALNSALPALKALKLPPPAELMKLLESAAQVFGSLPKPDNMPSLADVVKVINTVSNTVNGVVAAPAPAAATSG